ncbi:MAG: dihydrofolate reductase [Candidatus Peregrinibacteria bacterium]|nr:dihydrofolate reductase [Candidatus Peregrinibacteria bacterium]MDZ4244575.1 dihydrofolate reductase [Candidatus Gracilibacteria bacterium]
MKFSMIVACDKHRGIGRDNDLPWHLPTDMKYFRDTTRSPKGENIGQNAVIMGRRTYESLPIDKRPLPKRLNIILSRNPDYQADEGVLIADSLDTALTMIESYDIHEVFVIGGGHVYADAINHPSCDKLYITEIDNTFECDTFFPEFSKDVFKEMSRSDAIEENGSKYEFAVYQKNI